MRKILLIIFFTTSVYAQSNWKFDIGMFMTPAMNIITFTRYSELNDGRNWYFSTGLPGIAVLGIAKDYKDGNGNLNHITGSIGVDPGLDALIRIAWSKEFEFNEKLSWSFGINFPLAIISYGSDGGYWENDEYIEENYNWEIKTIITTAGSSDVINFIPLPMLSLTYDIGK